MQAESDATTCTALPTPSRLSSGAPASSRAHGSTNVQLRALGYADGAAMLAPRASAGGAPVQRAPAGDHAAAVAARPSDAAAAAVPKREPRAVQRLAVQRAESAPATSIPDGLDVVLNKTKLGPFELQIVANADGFGASFKAEKDFAVETTIEGILIEGKVFGSMQGDVQVDSQRIQGSGVLKVGGEAGIGVGVPGISVKGVIDLVGSIPSLISGSTDKGLAVTWPIRIPVSTTPKLVAECSLLTEEQMEQAAQHLPTGWDLEPTKGLEYSPTGELELVAVVISERGITFERGKDLQRIRDAVEALKAWAGIVEKKPLITNPLMPGALLINAGLSALYAYTDGPEDEPPPQEKKEPAYTPGQCKADFKDASPFGAAAAQKPRGD